MKTELSNKNIEAAVEQVTSFLAAQKYKSKEISKHVRLTEAILKKYQSLAGADTLFTLTTKRTLSYPTIRIQVFTDSLDFRESGNTEEEIKLNRLIALRSNESSWSYRNGCNYIHIVPGKHRPFPMLLQILIAVALAAVTPFVLPHLPAGVSSTISETIIPQLATLMNAMLRMIAGLMIFFTICTSIINIGDINTLKKTMGKMFLRIFLDDLFLLLYFGSILVFLCPIGQAEASLDFTEVFELFISMIPTDVFQPFINGNMMQITLLANALGITSLILGRSVSSLSQILEELQQISQFCMKIFCRFLPLLVFLNLSSAFGNLNGIAVENIILPIVVLVIASLVLGVIEVTELCLLHKANPKKILRCIMPATISALSTAASSMAIPLMKKGQKDLGVDDSFSSFTAPMEQVFYKPYAASTCIVCLLAVYRIFGLNLSAGSLVSLGILTMIIAFVCPSVPGGMLSCLTILASQLVLPEGALGIMILIDTISDNLATGSAVFSMQIEMTGLAYRNNKLH